MNGFDEQAKSAMLLAMEKDGITFEPLMHALIDLAMQAELDYLRQAGILEGDTFGDGEYDEEDAYDFIVDHVSKAMPEADFYTLTDYIEHYLEYHDQYLQEIGLLEWC